MSLCDYLHDPEHIASAIREGQCLSEETLKAVGPFYMVSMPGPGEVKYPTQGVNV